MGQAGAQREPSMEEILASIRRIIENNETDRPQPAEMADPEMDDLEVSDLEATDRETAAMEAALAEDLAADVPAAAMREDERSDPRMSHDAMTIEAAPEPVADYSVESPRAKTAAGVAEIFDVAATRHDQAAAARLAADEAGDMPTSAPISLADVAARIRAEPSAPIGTVLDDAAVVELHDMLGEEAVTPALTSPAAEPRRTTEGLQAVARAMAAQAPEQAAPAPAASAAPTPAISAEPVAAPREPAPQAVSAADAEKASQTQLVSVDTGARVAASFEALSHAVSSGNLRSFDEIAEDLLRPMLQSWLDDNLPTLVERLVREEIERVSRGPRR